MTETTNPKRQSLNRMLHDSEKLFDECVKACGGVRVTDIVGHSPQFKNADYFFAGEQVVAELKSLQKDFLNDAQTQEKMHLLFNEWVDAGRVPPAYGHLFIRTDEIPTDCAIELLELFEIPFKRVLRDADQQIQETKRALDCPNALGLLCLANDGNFALDPQMAAFFLNRCLSTSLPSIEHVILFSANLVTNIPGIPEPTYLFASVRIPQRRQISDAFWNNLLRAWSGVLEKALGKKLVDRGSINAGPDDLKDSRFRPPP